MPYGFRYPVSSAPISSHESGVLATTVTGVQFPISNGDDVAY